MPEGSYIIWVDFEKCGMSEEEVRSRIIDKANVMLSRGIKRLRERETIVIGFVQESAEVCWKKP